MHDLVENGGGTVIQKWKRKQNERTLVGTAYRPCEMDVVWIMSRWNGGGTSLKLGEMEVESIISAFFLKPNCYLPCVRANAELPVAPVVQLVSSKPSDVGT